MTLQENLVSPASTNLKKKDHTNFFQFLCYFQEMKSKSRASSNIFGCEK